MISRLCIAAILKSRAGGCVILLGMKCSSWTVVNMGTSKRCPCCPAGDQTKLSVKQANTMAARTIYFLYQNLNRICIPIISDHCTILMFSKCLKTCLPHGVEVKVRTIEACKFIET